MQKPLWAVLAALALAASGVTRTAPAQQLSSDSPSPNPIVRMPGILPGLSITLGAGVGKRKLYCGGCAQAAGFAGLANLSLFVSRAAAIGMESTISFNDAGPVTSALGSAMGAVTFWVDDQLPLSISGGLGFLVYHEANGEYGSNSTSAGFGCSGRLGYDARLSPAFALVPYVGYLNSLGHLKVGRARQVVSNLQFGMALRFR
jgi:hypothetical protein